MKMDGTNEKPDMGTVLSDLESDAQRRLEEQAQRKMICICGHPMGWHSQDETGQCVRGHSNCGCECRQARAVLQVSHTQGFNRKSENSESVGHVWGSDHALGKGMTFAASKGVEMEWAPLAPWACDSGACENWGTVPVMFVTYVDRDRYRHEHYLMCAGHAAEGVHP